MTEPLAPQFNELSLVDKFTLKSASLFKAVTRLARDDTRENPARYPFYAGFLLFLMAPIPVPGSNIIPIMLFIGATRLRFSPWARRADDRMRTAFNSASVMAAHDNLLHRDDQGKLRLNKIDLAKQTARATVGDLYDATRFGWRALRKRCG